MELQKGAAIFSLWKIGALLIGTAVWFLKAKISVCITIIEDTCFEFIVSHCRVVEHFVLVLEKLDALLIFQITQSHPKLSVLSREPRLCFRVPKARTIEDLASRRIFSDVNFFMSLWLSCKTFIWNIYANKRLHRNIRTVRSRFVVRGEGQVHPSLDIRQFSQVNG